MSVTASTFNPNDPKTWPVYLTYVEAGAIARVSENTIRWWVATARLSRRKHGRHPMVKRDDLVALIESTATPTVASGD